MSHMRAGWPLLRLSHGPLWNLVTTVRYEDDFRFQFEFHFSQKKKQISVVAVGSSGDETRQDVEQGSILPANAEKLLSLHGPSN